METLKFLLMSLMIIFFSTSGFAATVIESMDGEGSTHKMWVEGIKMRIDISNEPNYMLFDAENGKMYSVNPEEKQVLDLSSTFQDDSKRSTAEKYQAKFVRVGKGPEIAGYATEEYEFVVNSQKCSNEFLSTGALRNFESLDIFEALSKIGNSASMEYGMVMMDPCDSAQISFDKTYSKLGFPLRIVDRGGSLESEITKITKKVTVPADWFAVPSGYEVVDLGRMMQQGMQGYNPEQAGRMMPPEGNALGPEVDPEKLQQMMQEMMQQMGREK